MQQRLKKRGASFAVLRSTVAGCVFLRRDLMKSAKLTALLLSCLMVLPFFGCSQSTGSDSSENSTSSAKEPKAVPDKVELKNYKFPEFLEDIKQPDVLSSPVYVSFAAADLISEVTEQPFEGYYCTEKVGSSLYIFEEGKFKGLLDMNGGVVIEADTYTSISPCSSDILVLSRDKELNAPDDYISFTGMGTVTRIEPPEFKAELITVTDENVFDPAVLDDPEAYSTVHDLVLQGQADKVGEGTIYCNWESIEPVTAQSINTSRPYSAYYIARKNGEFYYICFDRFYNYTVYNGAYGYVYWNGYVRLKVGEGYGECYILDSTDYSELSKLLESFGETSASKTPSKDEALDYIQLETGYGTDDVVTMTISADGYCLTDHSGSGEQLVNNKYFSILDKESFVSLVKWVDQVLAKEYVR